MNKMLAHHGVSIRDVNFDSEEQFGVIEPYEEGVMMDS